jgi:hypothetical protein
MDLKDLAGESRYNNRKRFLLVVLDIFSKKAWIEGISNKSGSAVVKGLEKIYARSGGIAPKIQCDFGREFFNSTVQGFLRTKNVELFHVESELKCCTVERFIRTLFGKIQRYLTHNKTRKFIDKLQHFENLYNNSYHRTIGMTPNQVSTENQTQVYEYMYGRDKIIDYKPAKFKVGDTVLVAKRKTVFEKGYKQNYLPKVFVIAKIRETSPRVYILADKEGSIIKGTFYEQQLVKVNHQ